jgi:hypothetical protein
MKTHKTRLSICRKKSRYPSADSANTAAQTAPFPLHPYRCNQCHHYHLTSRSKGIRIPRPEKPL